MLPQKKAGRWCICFGEEEGSKEISYSRSELPITEWPLRFAKGFTARNKLLLLWKRKKESQKNGPDKLAAVAD
ncbi:MAG: hypothetical protein Q8P67_02705 [archaeon]|nr:hypothetical protein [archaeon]